MYWVEIFAFHAVLTGNYSIYINTASCILFCFYNIYINAGMTRTGDHGGETIEEIDSALFVFSRNGKFAKPSEIDSANCDNGLVHQVYQTEDQIRVV